MIWKDRNVLVTGGTGFVGKELVSRLLQLEVRVTLLVRDWTPEAESLSVEIDPDSDELSIVSGDVCDQELLTRVLCENEIETVFHLAAQTLVPIANRRPASTFKTNIMGTVALCEAAEQMNGHVKQIIIASSDKAYGEGEGTGPYVETMPLRGRHPYDCSKACQDLVAQSYAMQFNLPIAITRCGNIFGPGDWNMSRIVPSTIRSFHRGERPVIRSSGRMVRDYFYLDDAVSAYVLLAEKMAAREVAGGHGQAFNFSYEEPLEVLEIVERIRRIMGTLHLEPDILNEAHAEIHTQVLCAQKARDWLGWEPEHTIDSALQETINWYRGTL